MASPYVPLDSWIYPALDRLAALGYVETAYVGIRPWTRMACARMVDEGGERLNNGDANNQAASFYRDLSQEFAPEIARLDGAANLGVKVDSLYTRVTSISGKPLNDGYHFGQTLVNDFGRLYGEGASVVSGGSASAVAGPFAFFLRGEFQHAPATASDPNDVLQAIAAADFTLPVSNARPEVNRFDVLDGEVAFAFHNLQFTFGKQSQWLGPGSIGPLLFSDNAEPVLMAKMDQITPFEIPLLSRLLGPARTEFFFGQLGGAQFEFNNTVLIGPGGIYPQPFLHGSKISFKPTPNFEFGMGYTAQIAGPGLPLTWHNFFRSIYSHTQGTDNPGKRLSQADFSYRVPGLRQWLTVYGDAMVVDEYSPIGSTRANVAPGIYMPQIPKVPNLELRAEGIHESTTNEFPPGFVYYGVRRYRSGYTNDGVLLGNWIGRAGRGGQGWLTYWFSPRSDVQMGYRLQEVSPAFLEGGRLVDYSATANLMLSRELSFAGTVQYEQWSFPILATGRQSDVTASVQLTFWPHWQIRR